MATTHTQNFDCIPCIMVLWDLLLNSRSRSSKLSFWIIKRNCQRSQASLDYWQTLTQTLQRSVFHHVAFDIKGQTVQKAGHKHILTDGCIISVLRRQWKFNGFKRFRPWVWCPDNSDFKARVLTPVIAVMMMDTTPLIPQSESNLESSVESYRALALGECSVGFYRWFYVTFACWVLGGISGVVIMQLIHVCWPYKLDLHH